MSSAFDIPTPPSPYAVLRRIWHSPTVMTWASIGARLLGFAAVLPLVLSRFSAAEITVWYLFTSIIALQAVADAGFAPTCARAVAYAYAGATSLDAPSASADSATRAPNLVLLSRISATAHVVYDRLAIIGVCVLGVGGSLALIRPMSQLSSPLTGWLAWCAVLIATAIALWSNYYAAFLQGMNQIAILRRWDTITALGSVFTSVAVLLFGGKLLPLVLANQCWVLVVAIRDRQLVARLSIARAGLTREKHLDDEIFHGLWSRAWRSGVGIGMSRGVAYASGIVFAQFASAGAAGSYLVAFRLMQALSEISQAPFYSKIPQLARLRSEGRFAAQIKLAARGMRLSHWTFVSGFVLLGIAGPSALRLVHSHVAFPAALLWFWMGLAVLAERYGAMHMQLYSTTNHILWHVANGITGAITILATVALIFSLGVYAFPIASLIGSMSFYSWYSARLVYRNFDIRFFPFELRTSVGPICVTLLFGLLAALA